MRADIWAIERDDELRQLREKITKLSPSDNKSASRDTELIKEYVKSVGQGEKKRSRRSRPFLRTSGGSGLQAETRRFQS